MSSDCVFCSIVSGSAPRTVVYEDHLVLGFMDLYPVNPGHLLVVPKEHATHLRDLPEETAGRVMVVAMRLANAIQASPLCAEGTNLFLADGRIAGQVIFHTHMHVIPRFDGDGFNLRIDYDPAPSRTTLDEQAALIAAALTG